MIPHPLVLIILDGWGHRTVTKANAIAAANTPIWNQLINHHPYTTLSASGLDVGLPAGQMGNSEVGHLTIGAGRTVFQDLTRISMAVENGLFNQNPVLLSTLDQVVQNASTLHIIGLLSPGGVHSHEHHIQALVQLAAKKQLHRICIHAILDGRDTPPKSAEASLLTLENICQSLPKPTQAKIASISGRYYAMDRDQRWDRTQAYFDLLTVGKASGSFKTALQGLMAAYARGETDEFVKPTMLTPVQTIQHGDAVVMMNFRADRIRQLSIALAAPHFLGFSRAFLPKLSKFVTLTEYAKDLNAKVAFPHESLKNTLGEYLQTHHLKQLRIAETEKYAHVTFFFNGGREAPFLHEHRILIPSPLVSTYDVCPEMSAFKLTEKLIQAIEQREYGVIICNYANADMVGHTGNFQATVKAIEVLDTCLGKVLQALNVVGGEAFITADHGNAELMFDEISNQPHTAHTLERVPFIYVGRSARVIKEFGMLSDISPTLLSLLNLPKPTEMTGTPLIQLS